MLRLNVLHDRRSDVLSESGASAVGFSIVAPILLTMGSGIGVHGIYFGDKHNLDQFATKATRATTSEITDEERSDLAHRSIDASLRSGSLFQQGSLAIAVGSDPGDNAIYTVTRIFDATTLRLNGFARLLPMPPDLLRSSVSLRRDGL